MKKFILIMIVFFLVTSFSAVPAHAYSFSDFNDGGITDVFSNDIKAITNVFSATGKLVNGDIGVDEYVNILVENSTASVSANCRAVLNEIQSFCSDLGTGGASARAIGNFAVNLLRDYISDNGGEVSNFPVEGNYWIVGHKGNECKIVPISFPSLEAMNAAGFNYGDNGYPPGNYPHSVVAVYTSDGSLYYFYSNGSTGRPSDRNTLENVKINSISYLKCDQSHDYYNCSLTVSYFKNGVLIDLNINTALWLPPYHYYDGDVPAPELVTDTPNVDNLTDDDLLKYIDNLIKNIDKTYPDMSTIEGKLQEIINLLNKLNTCGCDCSELAAAINALISRLDNNDLSQTLKDLQKLIENNTSVGGVTDLTPVTDKIDELQKELLKAYAFDYSKDDIKAVTAKYDEFTDTLIKKKFKFVTSLIDIINLAINTYSNSSGSSFTVRFKFISREIDLGSFFSVDQLQTIRCMIAAYIYVRFALSVYRRIPSYINNGGDK